MLTVRDVLEDLDVRLVAGEGQLDAPVRWVHISELPDPTPFLSGGELLLTTGMALESPADQRAYVTTLADHGLAGLGLGTGFAHAEVPSGLREAAAEREFPLFEVPYEVPFIAITERAFARLVNEQYALLQRSIAAQERLQRIVLGERGLDAIAAALAALVGGAVLVFDGRGQPMARGGPARSRVSCAGTRGAATATPSPPPMPPWPSVRWCCRSGAPATRCRRRGWRP
jgi:purine catabolism regulator